jgi:hypothetical protein
MIDVRLPLGSRPLSGQRLVSFVPISEVGLIYPIAAFRNIFLVRGRWSGGLQSWQQRQSVVAAKRLQVRG